MTDAARYEYACICALPHLLKAKDNDLVKVISLGTVVPHQLPQKASGLFVYQCVYNAMYMDHISLDFQWFEDIQYCAVGIYQATINTHDHADSYVGVASDPRLLPKLIGNLQLRNPGVNIQICFFWMVNELRTEWKDPTKTLRIKGSTLRLVEVPKKTHEFLFRENSGDFVPHRNKFNFMYDDGRMYKVSNPRRERCVYGRKLPIDEYVFKFDGKIYAPPKFVPE